MQESRQLIKAAKNSVVKFILLLSILDSESCSNAMTKQFAQIEEMVEESGIQCSILRTNFYMENVLLQSASLSEDEYLLPIQQGKLNFVAMDDVARVVAKMLAAPEKFAGRSFDLNGCEALTGKEIARHLSQTLNKQITFRSCSPEEYREVLVDSNVPQWLAQAMASYIASFESKREYQNLNTTEFFHELTGEKQLRFTEWLEENLDTLKSFTERHRGRQARNRTGMTRGGEQNWKGNLITLIIYSYLFIGGARRSGMQTTEMDEMDEMFESKNRNHLN